MSKKASSRKRHASKSQPQNAAGAPGGHDAFHQMLEDMFIYDDGEPADHLGVLKNTGGTEDVGYWQLTEDWGADGLGGSCPPFYSVLEMIFRRDGLYVQGWSSTYPRPGEPTDIFCTRHIRWRQSKTRFVKTPAVWGAPTRWRKYQPKRVDEAIRAGVTFIPWLVFEFLQTPHPHVTFEPRSLFRFLAYCAWPTGTKPGDKKFQRRLLRAIGRLDPGSLAAGISSVIAFKPELREPLRRLLPTSFTNAVTDLDGGKTVKELASAYNVSESQVRRRANRLRCTPLIGKNRCFIFLQADVARIAKTLG